MADGRAHRVAVDVPATGRVMRRPQHPFVLRTNPWQIQPMLIAPVLPGETLKSLLLQARTVTDPIKNRLMGWWNEYYFFYVKHRDLDDRDDFVNMMLDPNWDAVTAGVTATTDVAYKYFEGGATGNINWVDKCYRRVIAEYFRAEGDAYNAHTIGSTPSAAITGTNVLDSAVNFADLTFPDVDVDADSDGTITMGEIDQARAQYEFLRNNYAVDLTYEDFLKSYGVRVETAEELHKPELLRFVRNWQYPVSAINPSTGAAASAVTWDVTERADKDRFFKEPGFIFGVQVTRPKVYLSGQKGSFTALMKDAYTWLPAVLLNDPKTSLVNVPDNDVLGDLTDAGGAWVDIRDLLLYGEQFVNFALTETDANLVALPTAGMETRYASDADMQGLFVGSTSTTRLVRTDGIVTLNILGRQIDQSAGPS